MRKEKGGYIKWIIFALLVTISGQITGFANAESYNNPTVVVDINCGDTYKYGDMITVKVLVENVDSCKKYGERSFKATKKSYTIKAGATEVKWHHTYKSGYEKHFVDDFNDFEKTITVEMDPLKVIIAGISEATEHCEPIIFTAVVKGGLKPYNIAWAGKGSGTQTSVSGYGPGKLKVSCQVSDSADPPHEVTASHEVTVHKKEDITDPSVSEEPALDEEVQMSDWIRGDPTGQPVDVCISKQITEKTSIDISIEFPIEAVKAKVGYSSGEDVSTSHTYCYHPMLRPNQRASIRGYPLYEIKTGDVKYRNCRGVYKEGTYTGKKLLCAVYELKLADI